MDFFEKREKVTLVAHTESPCGSFDISPSEESSNFAVLNFLLERCVVSIGEREREEGKRVKGVRGGRHTQALFTPWGKKRVEKKLQLTVWWGAEEGCFFVYVLCVGHSIQSVWSTPVPSVVCGVVVVVGLFERNKRKM